jgi:hypothetical protein
VGVDLGGGGGATGPSEMAGPAAGEKRKERRKPGCAGREGKER